MGRRKKGEAEKQTSPIDEIIKERGGLLPVRKSRGGKVKKMK